MISVITCTKCKTEQPDDNFRVDPKKRNGRRSHCKECDGAYARGYQERTGQAALWAASNPEKFTKIQRKHIAKRYGITYDDYERMLVEQNGRCAICGTDQPKTRNCRSDALCGPIFAIDHCHTTGKVRGLLCMNCNAGIGNLKDDPALLRAALAYLERG